MGKDNNFILSKIYQRVMGKRNDNKYDEWIDPLHNPGGLKKPPLSAKLVKFSWTPGSIIPSLTAGISFDIWYEILKL